MNYLYYPRCMQFTNQFVTTWVICAKFFPQWKKKEKKETRERERETWFEQPSLIFRVDFLVFALRLFSSLLFLLLKKMSSNSKIKTMPGYEWHSILCPTYILSRSFTQQSEWASQHSEFSATSLANGSNHSYFSTIVLHFIDLGEK